MSLAASGIALGLFIGAPFFFFPTGIRSEAVRSAMLIDPVHALEGDERISGGWVGLSDPPRVVAAEEDRPDQPNDGDEFKRPRQPSFHPLLVGLRPDGVQERPLRVSKIESTPYGAMEPKISLPEPSRKGGISVEEALSRRRSFRSFQNKPLTLKQFSQIFWAAYGVTGKDAGTFLKTSPSAGALYPCDVYGVVGEKTVEGLKAGVYHYVPEIHTLSEIRLDDVRAEIARGSLDQSWMAQAPVMIAVTAEYPRITRKYGDRGIIYAHMEAGHIAQNVFLQAEAMGLKVGIVGAFENEKVIKTLGLPKGRDPLLILPVGYPR